MTVYELLGVGRGADIEEIKPAYRKLANALHPDVNAGEAAAAERCKETSAAYNLLANRNKQVEYDLADALRGGLNAHPQPWEKGAPGLILNSTRSPVIA